jgi:hypothetical protein
LSVALHGNMAETPDDTIDRVFKRFEQVDDEQSKWTALDDNMSVLAYLDDDQIVREAESQFTDHVRGKIRCKMEHGDDRCFAPTIVKATGFIIADYNDLGNLHANRRYVLEYYLSLSKIGEIFLVKSKR